MDFTVVTTDTQILQVAILAGEIWTEHFTPIIGADQVAYMLDAIQSKNAIAYQIRSKGFVYYLIENNSKPIGYCAIKTNEDSLFLSKLYIQKSMRRKGLGQKTIAFIRSIACKNMLDTITLTVNKNNLGPITAYEQMGFVNIGSVVQDIGGGFVMDDYKMQLNVK